MNADTSSRTTVRQFAFGLGFQFDEQLEPMIERLVAEHGSSGTASESMLALIAAVKTQAAALRTTVLALEFLAREEATDGRERR